MRGFLQVLTIVGGLGSVLLATPALAQKCEPERVAQKYPEYAGKVIKVAVSPTNAPYTYVDPADPAKITGLEIELIEEVMNCAGLKVDYLKGAWSGLLPTIFSGAADVMVGNVVYRADRGERADFILFYVNGQSFLVPKGNPKKIAAVADLCGKSASAVVGGAGALEVDKQSKACVARGQQPISFQPSVDQESAARQLANGRIDFMPDGAAAAVIRAKSEKDLEIAFTISTELAAGFVVKKGNDALSRLILDGMKALEARGRIAELMKKYEQNVNLLIPVELRR